MDIRCPECGQVLELVDGDEMGSAPRRYLCHECQILFESHPAGGLVEVDD